MRRVLLIGLDGLEPALLEQWMGEGRLPSLARLAERGTLLPCRSTTPPATFPAWTTCVTGVNPGRHGIFDFTSLEENKYAIQFTNASSRQAPALWTVLSEAGKRVCVLGVPATYPPEAVNGVMVSGFDSPVCTAVDKSFVYPPAHFPAVREWRFADFQESDIGPGWHGRALAKLHEGIATKERIALNLLAQERWDFFMLVFGESDTVAHHFWAFHDPGSPRRQPGHRHAIRDIYERLDAAVGCLVDKAGEDVMVGVVSDHGFGGAGTGVVHLNNWLAREGELAFRPGGESLMKRAALAFVPESWRGAAFRRLKRLATGAESRSRFAFLDWAHTRAWSEELSYFPSIHINLKGRQPEGQVDAADYDAYCTDLCRRLESWDGVQRAWKREALYHGPEIGRAPDIVLEIAEEEGYSQTCLRARGGEPSRRLEPREFLGGKERGMTGTHRPVGVLILSEAVDAREVSLLDVAPTIYNAMGVTGPPMDGTSLLTPAREEMFAFARRQKGGQTRLRSETRGLSPLPNASPVYNPEQEEAVEQRLRNLGYFE